jgi:hypothetical protein
MGGTGANSIMLGAADAYYFTDGHGNALTPPANQIENPDPQADANNDTGGEFGDGRKSRALRHFDSRMRMSLRESRRFLIDNLSFHLILQSMDGHVTSIAPNRPDS